MEGRFLMVSTNVCFSFDIAILLAHTLVLSFGVCGMDIVQGRANERMRMQDEWEENEMEWYQA